MDFKGKIDDHFGLTTKQKENIPIEVVNTNKKLLFSKKDQLLAPAKKQKLTIQPTISSFFASRRPTTSRGDAASDDSASINVFIKETSPTIKTVLPTHCIKCNLPLARRPVTCTKSHIQNFGKTYLFCQRKLLKPVGVDRKTLSAADLMEYKQACDFYMLLDD